MQKKHFQILRHFPPSFFSVHPARQPQLWSCMPAFIAYWSYTIKLIQVRQNRLMNQYRVSLTHQLHDIHRSLFSVEAVGCFCPETFWKCGLRNCTHRISCTHRKYQKSLKKAFSPIPILQTQAIWINFLTTTSWTKPTIRTFWNLPITRGVRQILPGSSALRTLCLLHCLASLFLHYVVSKGTIKEMLN